MLRSKARSSGAVCVNGVAHLVKSGESVIIGFELSNVPIEPRIILGDRQNYFVRNLG